MYLNHRYTLRTSLGWSWKMGEAEAPQVRSLHITVLRDADEVKGISMTFGAFSLAILMAGSHWEKRLLMNEIMTGSVDARSVVSKMTLALLEDSGWYKVNYSMAGDLQWGRHQGAEFVSSPCNHWKGAYHCNTTQFSGCTYNREAEGYCPIVNYNGDLPHWARYFPQANRGIKVFILLLKCYYDYYF